MNAPLPSLAMLAVASTLVACSASATTPTPPPRFARAIAAPNTRRDDAVSTTTMGARAAIPLRGAPETRRDVPPRAPAVPASQLKRVPSRNSAPTPPRDPAAVIAEANKRASQVPEDAGFFNSIMEYTFLPGSLFQVYTAPMRVTDLCLQPGEQLSGDPAAGDTVRWVLGIGRSNEGGADLVHVYVKPTRPRLQTNLTITTNRRTYRIELFSYEDAYMASVRWNYPQDDAAHLAAQATQQHAGNPVVSMDDLNFGYAVAVVHGHPAWTPTQVLDDGRKTIIRFPSTMAVTEAPALFLMREGDTQLVNYRVKGTDYIVDRLFDVAELRVGQQDQDIVRITRTAR